MTLAGQNLHASGRRRAVVVLIEGPSPDESLYATGSVAEVLEELQVPVFVWSFGAGTFAAHWSGERPITAGSEEVDAELDLAYFEAACDELRSTLEAQRVVWLAGRHPPPLIRLTAAAGIRLAGEVPEQTTVPAVVEQVLLRRELEGSR